MNTPVWQKNYGSGKPVSMETKADAIAGTIKLLLNGKTSSSILLPGNSATSKPASY
jgi:hypothetical protein